MKESYKPLEDRVVVIIEAKKEDITDSGIILTKEVDTGNKLMEVKVAAVGDGVKDDGTNVKMFLTKGQSIVIGIHTGVEYIMDKVTYRLIKQSDALFTIE
jgi:co-chaperonin GroES (HSP10)